MANQDADITRIGDITIALGKGREASGDKPAVSPAYRNVAAKVAYPTIRGINTLYELFERSVRSYGSSRCLGWRPLTSKDGGKTKIAGDYQWITYKETQEKAETLAHAMKVVGVAAHSKVGTCSANCVELMLVVQACNRTTGYCVPLYDSLGENVVEYIINHSEASIVFTSAEKFPIVSKALPSTTEYVKTLVYFGEAPPETIAATKKLGIKVFSFDEFMELGAKHPSETKVLPKAEDPACIMYTSGTTGNPKAVLLTHANIVAAVAGVQESIAQSRLNVGSEDSFLSYLPMAHILDRVIEEYLLSAGSSVGYWQGDMRKVTEDIAALRPTIFAVVPRVLDRIASGVQKKVAKAGFISRSLFALGYWFKANALRHGAPATRASPFWDWLVFNKVKKNFGGRVRFVVSGGAPLAFHSEEFTSVIMCCPVLQGYGLTETCGASFLTVPRPGMSGTVGPPISGTEFRFEGSAELGYDPLGTPPRGELCLRGPQIFSGYYKDAEKTKEAVDDEGWFHTGDVGELTEDGALKIIDRIKNMFKLAQGEYVAAEKLEGEFSKTEVVAQVWVYGNSLESTLVAVVVPESHILTEWAKQAGVEGDLAAICKSDKACEYVVGELLKTGKAQRLKGFEMIKGVVLEPEEFSVDNDCMTPSFKLKRPQLQKRYQKEIDAMYKKINAAERARG